MIRASDDINDVLNSVIPEDIFPPLRYIYKSKAIRAIENMMEKAYDGYLFKKLQEQKRTFDRSELNFNTLRDIITMHITLDQTTENIKHCLLVM